MGGRLQVRRADEIHHEEGGWFEARWHFSFGGYHDPAQTGLGALRVFNDDRIVAGAEWPMHPHRDIESLTYVLEGTFEHADSLGNGGRLGPGGAQVMRFSHEGALHSERNGSDEHPLRFLQFWVLPSEEGLESSVQQRQFDRSDRTGRWLQIMGPGSEEGLDLSQDARVLVSRLGAGDGLEHGLAEGRGGYLYVIEGAVAAAGDKLAAGDALKAAGLQPLEVEALEDAELILIDVPLDFSPVGIWAQRR